MKLSQISIDRPVLATMMSIGLVIFGIIGITRLPVRELPDIDPPIVNITTVYKGASAAVVETQLTEPIEETLTSVEGIRTLTSESREQVSSITIEFDLSRPIEVVAQDVRDRVSRVRGSLPDNIDEPIVAKQDADAQPVIWIALYSDRYSTLELTSMGENVFKDRLQTIPGVSSIIFGGAKRFAIRLWLDSQKMAARGVTVLDVDKALKEQNVELPSGLVESWDRALSIETRGELKTPEEYNNLVIRREGSTFIRLKDIGYAAIGVEDERSVARFNSKPCVGLGVVKQSKANTIDVAKRVKAELEKIKLTIPEGISASIPYDESIFVEKSIHEVWLTLGIAFFLVVLTVFIFLHNLRSTFIPSITIPVSIIATFGVLYAFGFSINVVTMLAFVLAIGLVVDDSIIVLENIYRHMENGMSAMQASITGMKEIGFVVIATTVALIAVFLPMAFQTSVTGRLFIEFAIAISFSVIISAFVALSLTPMLSSRILKPVSSHDKEGVLAFFDRWFTQFTKRYENMLGWSLKHPTVIMIICAGAIGFSAFFFSQLNREFLPDEDKGRLLCFALAPQGSTSEYTDRMVRKMETIVAATPEVEGYFSAVALARGSPGQTSQGLSFIRLKEKREKHLRDIVGGRNGLGAQFFNNVEGAFIIPIIPKSIGRGFSQPFQIVLQNQDLIALNKYATELSNKLRSSGYLINVRSTFELDKPELRVTINRDRAAALGVTVEDISRTLQIMFGGLDLSKVNISGKEYDVIVQLERKSRLSPEDLDKLYLRNAQGQLIQLNNVINYETGAGPSAINHYNRYRSATIEATPLAVPIGTAVERVQKIMKTDLPEGFHYQWTGEARDLLESSSQIYFVLILAAIIIYMVLAAQFESFIHPLTVMFTLPLAAFGAFGALWFVSLIDVAAMIIPAGSWLSKIVHRIPSMGINLYSQIGLILLFGLVTKNAILLVDFANQQMLKGKNATDAMLAAGVIRLRPIMMTACATIAGILPIAIGFGAGAESRRPLGVAAVGGMVTSTFLTLFIIPVVYVYFSRLTGKKVIDSATKMVITMMGLFLVSQTGCSAVGPNDHRPETKVPVSWKEKDEKINQALAREEFLSSDWWKIFNDPILNNLEEQALANNQDLKSAMASVDKARAIARVSRADLFPAADLNASAERKRIELNGSTQTNNKFSIPLDLSYEIDIWGKVRRAFEAGRSEAEASAAAYQTVVLTLISDVARHYFLLRETDSELETLRQTIDFRNSAVELINNRLQAGIISSFDLSRARAELIRAQTDELDAKRRRVELENALAVLCGQVASEFKIESKLMDIALPKIPSVLPSELLKRRPDIIEAEKLMTAANAKVGVAQASFFPSIHLSSSAGFQSMDVDKLFNWDSRRWSVGPSVSLPVFAGGRNQSQLEAAKAEYEKMGADYRQTILIAFQEVEDSLSNLNLRNQQAKQEALLVRTSRETARISRERYKQGLVNFLEVVDAERSRLSTELEAIQTQTQQLIWTVYLIKAIGGGWENQ